MWNQVGAEIILLIRTYAFFNRNIYVLTILVSGLAGLIAYQLYVATSQMLRESPVLCYVRVIADAGQSLAFCEWTHGALSSHVKTSFCGSSRWVINLQESVDL